MHPLYCTEDVILIGRTVSHPSKRPCLPFKDALSSCTCPFSPNLNLTLTWNTPGARVHNLNTEIIRESYGQVSIPSVVFHIGVKCPFKWTRTLYKLTKSTTGRHLSVFKEMCSKWNRIKCDKHSLQILFRQLVLFCFFSMRQHYGFVEDMKIFCLFSPHCLH